MKDYLAILGAVIIVLSGIPYIRDIVAGKTRPNVVSWFTWTLLITIGGVAALAANQLKTAIVTFGDATQVAIILLLGLKYGYAKLTWFDAVCQAAAIVGLVLWLIFNSPTIAIIATVTIDFIAAIPTFRHAILTPSEETWQSYMISGVGSGVGLLSLTVFNIDSLAYPLYGLLLGLSLSSTVIIRRRAHHISLFR